MLRSFLLNFALAFIMLNGVARATVLSPVEAEIERIYAQYVNGSEYAELEPIKALESRARDGDVRDQRAFWYSLCVMYGNTEQRDEAQNALHEMQQLAKRYPENVSVAADTLVCESNIAMMNKKSREALQLRQQAFEMVQEKGGDGFALYHAGVTYGGHSARQGDYDKGIAAMQMALRGADMLRDFNRFTMAQSSMAWFQFQFNQPEAALATYAAAKKTALDHHLVMLYQSLLNDEAVVLTTLGRYAEAQKAYESGLQYGEETNNIGAVLTAYVNLADIHLRQKNFTEAERYALLGLRRVPEGKQQDSEMILRFNLAIALAGQKQLKRARPLVEGVLAHYQQHKFLTDEAATWQEWSAALELNEEYKEALAAFQRYKTITDEINSKNREKAVLELQQQFEAEKQAKEIELLTKSNALKDVELVNSSLQKKVWWLLALLLAALLLVMGMFFHRVRAANLQLEQKNRELDYQSTRDPLTALYNRRYFQQLIASVDMAQSERRQGNSSDELTRALYLLDIDHFKRINDRFGHAAGDAVLREMAARLREGLRDNDVIVRWGGEEFLVFAQQLPMHMVQPLAQRILDLFALEPVKHDNQLVPVSCSVGYSLLPLKVGEEQLLGWERAVNVVDMALYLAKAHGRNRAYGITSLNIDNEASLVTIERDLESAWQNNIVNMQITLGPTISSPTHPTA